MKKISLLFLFFCSILLLGGCGNSEDWKSSNRIEYIEVFTAAENPENITAVDYPNNYWVAGKWHSIEETAIPVEELDEDIEKFLWEYIVNVKTPEFMKDYDRNADDYGRYTRDSRNYQELYKGHTFTCGMEIVYEDWTGERHYITRYCFDEFPEGWSEFIAEFNKICGGEYLTDEETIQDVTPEYFTSVTGITDEHVNGGNVEEFIRDLRVDMFDLVVERMGYSFEYDAQDYFLIKHLPKELIQTESTFEEFEAFVRNYVIGVYGEESPIYYGEENIPADDPYFYLEELLRFSDDGATCSFWIEDDMFTFFRTNCMGENYDYMTFKMVEDYGIHYYVEESTFEEGATMSTNFYYNSNGKYGLITESLDAELLEAFWNAE